MKAWQLNENIKQKIKKEVFVHILKVKQITSEGGGRAHVRKKKYPGLAALLKKLFLEKKKKKKLYLKLFKNNFQLRGI